LQVEKALTSPVPGTTLNLLKFPIMRPGVIHYNATNLPLSRLARTNTCQLCRSVSDRKEQFLVLAELIV
jgi:hypothetical protein